MKRAAKYISPTLIAIAALLLFVPLSCRKDVSPILISGVEKAIILVFDRTTDEPIEDAEIRIWHYILNTDENGEALLQLPDEPIKEHLDLVVRKMCYVNVGVCVEYEYLTSSRTITVYMDPMKNHQHFEFEGGIHIDDEQNSLTVPEGALPSGGEICYLATQNLVRP